VRQGTYAQQLTVVTTFEEAAERMRLIELEGHGYEGLAGRFAFAAVEPEEDDLLNEVAGHAAAARKPLQEARRSVDAFNPVQSARILTENFLPVQNRWLQSLDGLMQLQNRKIEARLQEFDASARRADTAIAWISGFALALAVVVAWWLTRSITIPLRQAVTFADAVADGRLSTLPPTGGRDEPGRLLKALGHMATRLSEAHDTLQRLVHEDPLTGASNRRHLDDALTVQHAQARRGTSPAEVSLLMLDVDHFKHYNDTFGHPQGDRCLRLIVDAVRAAGLRPGDVVARYGGEEFAVLLPHCSRSGAEAVAERVRAAVAALKIPSGRPQRPYVSVSIGVSAMHDAAAALPADWVRWADEALYEAKHAGRDQVRVKAQGAGSGSTGNSALAA
jgi:diguanylate cyclase (GGDEF)-like protein